MKKILVLGAGEAQADFIRFLSDRGAYVCACSYTTGDAGEEYADDFQQINIVDEEAVFDYAKEKGVDCVYSVGSDVAMPVVTGVSERLGLPTLVSSQTARLCNVKSSWRSELGSGFPGNVRFQELSTCNDGLAVDFPVMLKPVDSQGQRGVRKAENFESLALWFDDALSYSKSGKVIVEEFIEGREVSVNTFSIDGEIRFFLLSDRVTWGDLPGGIIHKHVIPSSYQDNQQVLAALEGIVAKALSKLGINNGPAYFQVMITPQGEPKLVEVTPRLDGCHMWRVIEHATGVNLLEMTVDLLLTGKCNIPDSWSIKPCELEFFCAPPSSRFVKSAFDVDSPAFLHWYYDEGESVRKMNGYMEKCGYQIVSR